MQSLIDKYGSAATQTDEWKQSVSQLEAVLPGASSIIQKHENDIENVVTDLNAAIEKEKQFAIEAAKKKATQDKLDAYAQASAEYAAAVYQKGLDEQRIAGAKEKVAGFDNIGYYDGAGQFLVDPSTGELNMDMFKSLVDTYGAAQLAKDFVDPTGALEGTEGYEEKLGEAQGAIQALADA